MQKESEVQDRQIAKIAALKMNQSQNQRHPKTVVKTKTQMQFPPPPPGWMVSETGQQEAEGFVKASRERGRGTVKMNGEIMMCLFTE